MLIEVNIPVIALTCKQTHYDANDDRIEEPNDWIEVERYGVEVFQHVRK